MNWHKHERQSEKQLLFLTWFAYVLIEIKLQNLSSEEYEFLVQNMNFWMSNYEFLFSKVGRFDQAMNLVVTGDH